MNVFCYNFIANAETVITADQVLRGGKVGELKQMVDKAVAACPGVKRVFVTSRTGADVPMGELDFPLEKVPIQFGLFKDLLNSSPIDELGIRYKVVVEGKQARVSMATLTQPTTQAPVTLRNSVGKLPVCEHIYLPTGREGLGVKIHKDVQ